MIWPPSRASDESSGVSERPEGRLVRRVKARRDVSARCGAEAAESPLRARDRRLLVHAVLLTVSVASRPCFGGVGTPESGDVWGRETVAGGTPVPSGAARSRRNTRKVVTARVRIPYPPPINLIFLFY